jgi:alpha-L-fucosidase
MKKTFYLTIGLIALMLSNSCTEKKTDKMEWWRDARFGMFIHWGLYSIPAGEYDGKEIPGIGEWIMNTGKIPVAEYEKYASQFNPVDFNAEEWVKLAKDAGMKYIVITSKHHDGFAMFKSKVSNYNIVDATPFKRDVIAEMAAACKKYNMPFGLYYSQAQDWHTPGGAAIGGHWDKAQDGDMDAYLDSIAIPQVSEILNNYGPIKILWFDTPEGMTPERAAKFMTELAKHPDLIINNRLGGGIDGDLETPEQYIPATGIPGKNWESCMTMNDTWGFKSNDQNWKDIKTLVRNLIDIASKGGNYLLNVGPTSLGLIPEASVTRLKAVGAWMKVNGEAIYGTSANPFKQPDWGRCTRKNVGNKELLYLHIFETPANKMIELSGIDGHLIKAYPLADKNKALKIIDNGYLKKIDISNLIMDSISTVIVIEAQKGLKIYNAPDIITNYDIYIDSVQFESSPQSKELSVRFTTDGSSPTENSTLSQGINKFHKTGTFTVKAASFLNDKIVSGISEHVFTQVVPIASVKINKARPGLKTDYYEGQWDKLPDFSKLKIIESVISKQPDITVKKKDSNYGLVFTGFMNVPETAVYKFILTSDDGSAITISGNTLVNDGLHGMTSKTLDLALEKGLHPVELQFFQAGGGDGLEVKWQTGDAPAFVIPLEYWVH